MSYFARASSAFCSSSVRNAASAAFRSGGAGAAAASYRSVSVPAMSKLFGVSATPSFAAPSGMNGAPPPQSFAASGLGYSSAAAATTSPCAVAGAMGEVGEASGDDSGDGTSVTGCNNTPASSASESNGLIRPSKRKRKRI